MPALKLLKRGLELIDSAEAREILSTIVDVLDAYDERVVEFPRGEALVFADDAMRTTSLSLSQVTVAIDESKRAYSEVYR